MPYRKRTLWGGVKPPAGSPLDLGDPINSGLLCCYLMNENAGLFVRDIASEIDLQINAATDFTWQAGKHGPAVGRGSASGWMVSSKTPAVTGGQVTCGGWINYTQTTGEWVISQGVVNTNWQLFLDSGLVYYRVANLLPLTFTAPPINTWQHVMAVQNGTTATIYINGIAKASGTVTALPGTAAVMRVGAFSSATASYNFHGKLSGIRAWRRALSPTEILRLYNEPFAGVMAPSRRIRSAAAGSAFNPYFYRHIAGAGGMSGASA